MKNTRLKDKKRYLTGVSLLALAAGLTAGAIAAAGEPAETIETVVVTGERLSNQRAVETKRAADVITDSLASSDLNQLPDQNMSEALSRVPGVTSFEDEGSGLYVGMRGLSQEFVNVTQDGVEVSVAPRTWDSNLRGTNMEAIPSSFVSRIDVIKTMTPDMDGDAIAGTVDLVSRSALDAKKPWLTIGAAAGQYFEDVPSKDAGFSGKGSLSAGTTLADGRIGFVFDANMRNVSRDNLKPHAWYGGHNDSAELPDEVGGFFYERFERSFGLTGKLEFRPISNLQGYLAAGYFDSDIHIGKHKHALYGAVSNAGAGTFSRAVATGRDDDIRYGVDGSLTLTGAVDWYADTRNRLSVKISTSSSESYQDDPRVDWYYGGPLSGSYTADGSYYAYQLDAASSANFVNPANYAFNGYRHYKENLKKRFNIAKIDWANESGDGLGFGYRAGFKWKRTAVDYTSSYLRWRKPRTAIDFAQFLYTGDYTFPGTSNDTVVMGDIAALSPFIEEIGAGAFKTVEGYTNGNDYDTAENVLAGYAMISYGAERLRVVGGLRFEATHNRSLTRFNNADDGAWVETAGDYGDFLPSIAATYTIDDDLLLRAGVSRTVGRPDIRDLSRGETPPNDNGIYSRGNPDLKARHANNFDMSLEYYFDGGKSLISVAAFRKDISNDIFDLQIPYVFVNDLGISQDSYYVQPENAGASHINGLEFGMVKDRFDFLPAPFDNLGLTANVTFNDGRQNLIDANDNVLRRVAPEGLSKVLANVTLYYQGEHWSGRITQRFVGKQNQQLSVDGSGDLYVDSYAQTDLRFGYRFNKRFEIFGEVWNLFNDGQRFTNANYVSGVPNWYENVRYGRALWLGVNYKR